VKSTESVNTIRIEYPSRGSEVVTHEGISISEFQEDNDFDAVNAICKQVTAVWDTGATTTVVSKQLAKHLQLRHYGTASMVDVNSNVLDCETYLVDVRFADGTVLSKMLVATFDFNDCDMIIGMDIISQGEFNLSNVNGRTVFTFKLPDK
jgi:predicted aspartyl protease